jgi:outer membrane protein assembly factor BamB
MRTRSTWQTGAAAAAVAAVLLATACTSSQPNPTTSTFGGASTPSGTWAYPNGNLANTRVADTTITSANVSSLREAWSFHLTGKAAAGVNGAGSFAATPVVVNGVVYLQDLDANVYAISLATGKLRWEYPVNVPEASGPGPDGVAIAGRVVYGDTSTAVFALNAATGKVIWTDNGLLTSGQGSFEIQPQVSGGRVYLASAYGSGPGGGVLLALNASSGKLLWKFNTVAGGDAGGVAALGLGSGGAWETPLVGSDGSVTFGTGNPYQSIGAAIKHPARLLYTDSEVNLDAATGKLRWYYQAVPNDFKDHDIQASPVATVVGKVPAIIASGKLGIVYAMNATTGAVLWQTPVGVHNGTDNDSALLLEHKITIKLPYTWEPGPLGGVLTNMAVADGSVYVATLNVPIRSTTLSSVNGNAATPGEKAGGEIEALNLATGAVEWDTKVDALPLGDTTVASNLIFTTLVNGKLIALNAATGAIVYQHALPTTTNSPIAIAGNTVLVPAGGPGPAAKGGGKPQLVAYTVS